MPRKISAHTLLVRYSALALYVVDMSILHVLQGEGKGGAGQGRGTFTGFGLLDATSLRKNDSCPFFPSEPSMLLDHGLPSDSADLNFGAC